jgi:hypothetical protein
MLFNKTATFIFILTCFQNVIQSFTITLVLFISIAFSNLTVVTKTQDWNAKKTLTTENYRWKPLSAYSKVSRRQFTTSACSRPMMPLRWHAHIAKWLARAWGGSENVEKILQASDHLQGGLMRSVLAQCLSELRLVYIAWKLVTICAKTLQDALVYVWNCCESVDHRKRAHLLLVHVLLSFLHSVFPGRLLHVWGVVL